MPVNNLTFQGINRAVSDYANAGACEELINLRPTGTGLVPVKPFSVKMTDVTYDKVYVHKAGSATNYIALRRESSVVNIYLIDEEGAVIGTDPIDYFSIGSRPHFFFDQVHFASAGNIILFSVADAEDDFFLNLSYLWDGTQYNKRISDAPSISIDADIDTEFASGEAFTVATNPNLKELVDAINISLNAIEENNPTLCFGPVLIAFAYKTKDGNTFWTWDWLIYDPTPAAKAQSSFYVTDSSSAATAAFPNYFGKFYDGFLIANVGQTNPFTLYGAGIDLEVTLNSAFDSDKDVIESVEIYASRPIPYIDTEAILNSGLAVLDFFGTINNNDYVIAPVTKSKDIELGKQLLYLQKTLQMKELDPNNPTTISLSFGGNVQLTSKTLEVDAGTVTRYGDLLSYNARFHYFNSYAKTEIAMPNFTGIIDNDIYLADHHVFVVYNDGKKDRLLYLGTKELFIGRNYPFVIASNLNIREVHTYYDYGNNEWGVKIYLLKQSQTYNCTICTDGPADSNAQTDNEHLALISNHTITSSVITDEPDAINVTEQYNPFVFRVEHSYLAPGKVLDIQPQLVAVADVTYGDYPLNVFTNRGLYALLQGGSYVNADGTGAVNVLYGAFRPVSNLVTTANSVSTESGTFFLAAGNLWTIAGSKAVLISDALSLGPHKFIRDCNGYKAISNETYHVEYLESAVSFEEYVEGAILSYNRFRDELIISNNQYNYSYVLSLKYRQWFKIAGTFRQDVIGSNIAVTGDRGTAFAPGLSGEAPINGNWPHDLGEGGTVEIEITIEYDNGEEEYYSNLHTIQGGEEYNPELTVERIIDEWNDVYEEDIKAISYRQFNGYYYIKLECQKLIPGVAALTGIVTALGRGTEHWTEEFIFSTTHRNVVDFSDETEEADVLVHLQTRPFSVGYQFIHIHRVLAMIRSSLPLYDLLVVSLYGSDDLQNWKLLSYASRSGVKISQIRTPSAARSWRYYTVCIGGTCPVDTDFGTVIYDYEPVIRRIG